MPVCGYSTRAARTEPWTVDLSDPRTEEVFECIGAGDRTRTFDLLITNQLLYQLSYAGPAWGALEPPLLSDQTLNSTTPEPATEPWTVDPVGP